MGKNFNAFVPHRKQQIYEFLNRFFRQEDPSAALRIMLLLQIHEKF